MIRNPLAARLDPASPLRDQIRQAATLGLKGVVIEATGDVHPDRLGESGRREVRQLLRSVELKLVALVLPTRSGFDHAEELDARLRRADRAFALAYDLGTAIVLARVGPVPEEGDAARSSPTRSASWPDWPTTGASGSAWRAPPNRGRRCGPSSSRRARRRWPRAWIPAPCSPRGSTRS